MTVTSRERLRQGPAGSVAYLTIVSVLASAIGAVQAVVVARILGASAFGVVAIIAGLHAAVLNFIDVRLSDLATKLYYAPRSSSVSHDDFRASVLHICIVGNGLLSLALAVVGTIVALAGVRVLTSTEIQPVWVLQQGLATAILNWAGTFIFLQRLSGRYYVLGTGRLAGQLLGAMVLIFVLLEGRTLDAYFDGVVLSAVVAGCVAFGTSWVIWRALEGLPLHVNTPWHAWAAYRQHTGFLFFGNLLGYSKMFHRATDTLLVAALSTDAIVGVYRFARQVTDSLYVLYDALNQVFMPRFLSLLAEDRFAEFRTLAARLAIGAATLTAVLVGLEIAWGRWALATFLGSRFSDAHVPIIILTVPFMLAAGFQLWIWPIFVSTDRLRTFALISYAAVAVQYAVAAGVLWVRPEAVAGAAAGYLAHYVLLIVLSLVVVHSWVPGLLTRRDGRTNRAPAHVPESR